MILGQAGRYLVAGGLGTLAHLGLMTLCVENLGVPPIAGAVVGFAAAVGVSYALNHYWTFQSSRSPVQSFWRFLLVSILGLLMNTGMMYGLVHYLGWWYLKAQLSVILIVPATNFLLNRYWSFSTRAE